MTTTRRLSSSKGSIKLDLFTYLIMVVNSMGAKHKRFQIERSVYGEIDFGVL